MTDARYDAARTKLRRFLPPPPPDHGWLYARQRIEAQFLGPVNDDQATLGEAMMLMPAVLARSDAAPTVWSSNPYTWIFRPTTPSYNGAQGDWLDLWGQVLDVPRETAEADAAYGPRILSEILAPTTTNLGMAQAIDDATGVAGTQVLDAVDTLTIYRLNQPNIRLNQPGIRLNNAGTLANNGLDCCFIVRVSTDADNPAAIEVINHVVARRKAAGTRLLAISFVDSGSGYFVDGFITPGFIG